MKLCLCDFCIAMKVYTVRAVVEDYEVQIDGVKRKRDLCVEHLKSYEAMRMAMHFDDDLVSTPDLFTIAQTVPQKTLPESHAQTGKEPLWMRDPDAVQCPLCLEKMIGRAASEHGMDRHGIKEELIKWIRVHAPSGRAPSREIAVATPAKTTVARKAKQKAPPKQRAQPTRRSWKTDPDAIQCSECLRCILPDSKHMHVQGVHPGVQVSEIKWIPRSQWVSQDAPKAVKAVTAKDATTQQ